MGLGAEAAHRVTLKARQVVVMPRKDTDPPILRTKVAGLRVENPVGIAAGFYKNAVALNALLRLGFGFVEAGTVTPHPQAGNPKPRLFRLVEDEAIVNRMGFNNDGLEAALDRFRARHWNRGPKGIAGLNVGANKD